MTQVQPYKILLGKFIFINTILHMIYKEKAVFPGDEVMFSDSISRDGFVVIILA